VFALRSGARQSRVPSVLSFFTKNSAFAFHYYFKARKRKQVYTLNKILGKKMYNARVLKKKILWLIISRSKVYLVALKKRQ